MMHLERLALAPVFALVLVACGGEVVVAPAPVAAPGPVVVVDELGSARTAADIALNSLSKRNFQLSGCASRMTTIMAKREDAFVAADGRGGCSVIAVKTAEGLWEIVVRSGSDPANPQAHVIIGPAGGVKAINFAR